MQITEIAVSYEATQSLSGYCNVRPGIRLTAHVGEGENPQEIKTRLLNDARGIVQDEIDEALMRDGQPPRYYAGPRYRVEYNRETRQVVILPDTQAAYEALLRMGSWLSHSVVRPSRQMSTDQALAVAARVVTYFSDGAKTYTLVDCSDGNLARLDVDYPFEAKDVLDREPDGDDDDYEDEDDDEGDDEDDEEEF